jgi:O-antigen/teichoic acid export membrane protein
VTNFITNRVPDFIVGKIAGTHVLGLYSVAYEISNLPTTELVAPINRAVFPGYAKLSSDLAALREGYLSVLRMIALLTLPAVFGIAATANVFVPLVLGDKWLDAVELVEVLAFYGMLIAAENNTGSVYLAQGVPRLSMLVGLAHNCLRVPALIVGATQAGAYGAAMGILLAGAIMVPVNLTIVFRRLELGFMDFIRVFWRPLLAGISMFLAVAGMERYMGFGHDTWMMLIALAGLVCFGAATYVLIVLVLWTLSGRPDGAERALLAQAARHMTKAWSR